MGSWNIFNINYNTNQRLSIFGETQLRSLKFYNNFHYYEYKGGVNYKLQKNVKLTLAVGSYQTFKEGGNFIVPKNNSEFRIWPQLIITQSLGDLKVEQRYRSEFRFTSNGYRNRFRYRLGLAYPFGIKKNNVKPFQLNAGNEIFFTNIAPYFERNRISLSLNYRTTKTTYFQLGYVHQFDYKINDEIGRDFLQIGYFIELYKNNN